MRRRQAPKVSIGVLIFWIVTLITILYILSPARTMQECQGNEVPRYCVD